MSGAPSAGRSVAKIWQPTPALPPTPSRIANYDALLPIVRDIIRRKTCDEWLKELRAVGVPCGRINTLAEALDDPHVIERGFIVELEHPALGLIKSLATPIHLAETPLVYRRHPPRLGEHSDEVAAELGYSDDQVARLREDGVLA